jgi:CMP-N-acetylneuraminic acid synthetase
MNLVVIPARGGSKGIPRKNLVRLGGKPLVVHAIECARSAKNIDHVLLSTEDEEIARVGVQAGADVPFLRHPSLAQDATPTLAVLKDLLPRAEAHYGKTVRSLILLDPCAPLRLPEDVEGALRIFESKPCDLVVSCSSAHRNPYFNMVRAEGEWARLVLPSPDGRAITRRQDAPEVFDLNTVVWIFSRACIERGERLPEQTRLFFVPSARAVDLDRPEDLDALRARWDKL